MKSAKLFLLSLFFSLFQGQLKAQPIPIEVMFGNDYGAFELTVSKSFSPESRLGFFHLSSIEFGYDGDYSSIIVQELLTLETLKNLHLTGGIAYTPGGFSPTAGLQYIIAGPKFMFLCAPRMSFAHDLSYDVMTIIQYKAPLNDNLKLFTRAKLLNVFDANGNIKSYQWFRLGLDARNIQFGLAFNLDERGPSPSLRTNWGIFVSKEIF